MRSSQHAYENPTRMRGAPCPGKRPLIRTISRGLSCGVCRFFRILYSTRCRSQRYSRSKPSSPPALAIRHSLLPLSRRPLPTFSRFHPRLRRPPLPAPCTLRPLHAIRYSAPSRASRRLSPPCPLPPGPVAHSIPSMSPHPPRARRLRGDTTRPPRFSPHKNPAPPPPAQRCQTSTTHAWQSWQPSAPSPARPLFSDALDATWPTAPPANPVIAPSTPRRDPASPTLPNLYTRTLAILAFHPRQPHLPRTKPRSQIAAHAATGLQGCPVPRPDHVSGSRRLPESPSPGPPGATAPSRPAVPPASCPRAQTRSHRAAGAAAAVPP
jgi:hypothetical protein